MAHDDDGLAPDPPPVTHLRPEDAGVAIRFHDGNFVVDGLTPSTLLVKGILIVVSTPGGDERGGTMSYGGVRGDAFEAARALAHFLHNNPAFAAIVHGMGRILHSGTLSGEEGTGGG